MHFILVYHISKDFQVTCYVFPYVSVGVMYQGASNRITMLSRQRVSWLPTVRNSPKASSFHHPFNSPFLRFPHPQPCLFVYGMRLCFTWADAWALPGQTDFLLLPPVSPLCLCFFLLHTPLLLCQGCFCSSRHPRAAPAVPQLNVCRDGRAQHFSSFLLPCTFHPVSVLSSTFLMNS